MLDQKDVQNKVLKVRLEMQAKLGVQGRDLDQVLRRAGRRLPRGVRKQVATLAKAAFYARNPKMARRFEGHEVQAAYDAVMAHLDSIDVMEDRKDRVLGIAGAIAFNLLSVMVAFIFYLWWRGYV